MVNIDLANFFDGVIPLFGGVATCLMALSAKRRGEAVKGGRRLLLWLGPLLVIIGAVLVGRSLVTSEPNAKAIAAAFRSQGPIPRQLDDLTRLNGVDSSQSKVTFVMEITKKDIPLNQLANMAEALQSNLRESLCGNKTNQEFFKRGFLFEYIYFFNGSIFSRMEFGRASCGA
ncbi:hypothetical protein [Chromobacterium subtsugae]|uniref:hypothetical protein n=1 Tax=Chromobacterium subtsugae TaxID=251747 RepID=UPI00128C7F58|nr:hypothetical protein [Chromobacterium subtsugae]